MNQKESEENKTQLEEENQQPESVEGQEEEEEETVEEQDELVKLQEELGIIKDKYMRLHAEFDNFRKRNAREKLELIRTASRDVIQEILPIIDDFDRAIHNNLDNEDIEHVKEGFGLIHNKLINSLEQKGLKPMDAIGKKFNTDHHEAITQVPAPNKKMKGKVIDVVEKGYFLNDSVLRYAKVVVGQ